MRRITFLFVLALTPTFGQTNSGIVYTSVNPSGRSCNARAPVLNYVPSGVLYTCQSGSYATVASGGAMVYPSGSGIVIVSGGVAWGTTVAAPSGAVVGTTDTQTLTNKILSWPANNSTPSFSIRPPYNFGGLNDAFLIGFNKSSDAFTPVVNTEPQIAFGMETNYLNGGIPTSEFYTRYEGIGLSGSTNYIDPFYTSINRTTNNIRNTQLRGETVTFSDTAGNVHFLCQAGIDCAFSHSIDINPSSGASGINLLKNGVASGFLISGGSSNHIFLQNQVNDGGIYFETNHSSVTSDSLIIHPINGITANLPVTFGNITGSTQCLHVNTSGLVSGTGSDCGAGAGTVTVVGGGSLTATALTTGGGTTTIQTPSATATLDSSGNISTPGSVSTGVGGSNAGFLGFTQGAAGTPGTNEIILEAPASVTAYSIVLPGAAGTGLVTETNAAGVVTQTRMAGTDGQIPVGLTSTGSFVPHAMSGGATMDNAGVVTLGNPGASAKGGVQSIDCSSGGQFVQKVNTDGSETCFGPLHSVEFLIDGGGSAIAVGDLKVFPTAAFACTINRIDVSADQSGSVTVDIWKHSAGTIPTSADKISASAPATLSSAQLAQSGSLTGWTTSVSSGDIFGAHVATVATVQRVLIQIWCN